MLRNARMFGVVLCGVLLTVTAARGGSVLGINSQDHGGGIYIIDTVSGDATPLASTLEAQLGSSPWSGNGLAHDVAGKRIYYTSFGLKPEHLFVYDLKTGATSDLEGLWGGGRVASGSFYNGRYYYFVQDTADLRKVSFNTDGSIFKDVSLGLDNPHVWTYGDIAIGSDGILYGSAETSGGVKEFFKVDLQNSSTTVEYINSSMSEKYQLAFSKGELIGIATGSDSIYSLNTSNGYAEYLATLADTTLLINDAAPWPVPLPAAAWPAMIVLAAIGLRKWQQRQAASA